MKSSAGFTPFAVSVATLLIGTATLAAEPAAEVEIDVPVQLSSAKVVFNMDHLAFQGDLPVGIKYMGLFADRMKEQNASAQIVGVFHGEAGYMLLNDTAYNKVRRVSGGNPLKPLLATLIEKGIQLEECAVTMKTNGWTKKDLLPGIRVDTGAVIRLVQLHQLGFAQIQP